MLKNLSIGKQIGIGIGLILLVSALVATFAISGLQKSADNFSEYRMFARESVLSGRVQANMLIASNAARDFLRTRDEKAAETFDERFAAAREFAIEQQDLMDDPSRLEMSRQLVEELDEYDDKTKEVFELMRRRDTILQEQLNPQGVKMRENLEEIMVTANRDNDSESAYLAGFALKHVLLGRVHLLRFIEDNQNSDVLRVREELGEGFEQSYAEMADSIENSERQDRLRDFSAARAIYLSAFEEMVTLIESRNHLVDRQLNPLDQSIADTAERIKLSLKNTQDTLGPKVQADNAATVRAVIFGSVFAAFLAICIAWSIVRAVTQPVAELVETVNEVKRSGDLSSRLVVRGRNELGAMAETLNGFLASLEDKARIARNVARGKLDTEVTLLSEHDTMGDSLQDMLGTLKENEIEAASRDWVRDGQEKLNDEIRGVLERKDLVSRVIRVLSRHFDAQQGTFFLFDEWAETLRFAGGFGTGEEFDEETVFKLGEGLVGQAAGDREPIVVDQVPEDYTKIRSSLGGTLPRGIAVFPLTYEDRLLGVIEIASVEPIGKAKVDFFHSVEESICIALIAAKRQNELKTLLEQTQDQATDLAAAQKAADAASRAKSDFLSNMSHELRTPLNGVLGYVQILQRNRNLDAAQKKSLNSIGSCGEHLLNLINDVLDLSKIEAGKMEIALKATDLSQLIDGVQDIVKPKAESKGLAFNVKTSAEVPRGIVTDPMKLRQVLINLLGNSVKFTAEGAVSLRVAEAKKGELRFEIEDTGMGIEPDKLKDIFDPFKQAEGGESEGGTGLGLAISRRIAEALGGSLSANSEYGEGSCFTLVIPLKETDEINGSDFSVATPDSHASFCLPPGEKRSVLIADDRETNRDILNQILTDAGFETVLADDGDVALDRLRERAFDIFLCDVRMPRMNGIEVVKEIRQDEKLKASKVFAVTASVFPEFRDKALEAGFDEFLMKPLRVSELAQKMSKILDIEFIQLTDDEDIAVGGAIDPMEIFEELPQELIDELAAAAKVRNLTKLNKIASGLLEDEQTAVAGHHLEGMVVTFDFAGLQALVDELELVENNA